MTASGRLGLLLTALVMANPPAAALAQMIQIGENLLVSRDCPAPEIGHTWPGAL